MHYIVVSNPVKGQESYQLLPEQIDEACEVQLRRVASELFDRPIAQYEKIRQRSSIFLLNSFLNEARYNE